MKKIKKQQIFNIFDLYWRDSDIKEYKNSIDILNKLSVSQQRAVELFGESKYSKGYDDGYESGTGHE